MYTGGKVGVRQIPECPPTSGQPIRPSLGQQVATVRRGILCLTGLALSPHPRLWRAVPVPSGVYRLREVLAVGHRPYESDVTAALTIALLPIDRLEIMANVRLQVECVEEEGLVTVPHREDPGICPQHSGIRKASTNPRVVTVQCPRTANAIEPMRAVPACVAHQSEPTLIELDGWPSDGP